MKRKNPEKTVSNRLKQVAPLLLTTKGKWEASRVCHVPDSLETRDRSLSSSLFLLFFTDGPTRLLQKFQRDILPLNARYQSSRACNCLRTVIHLAHVRGDAGQAFFELTAGRTQPRAEDTRQTTHKHTHTHPVQYWPANYGHRQQYFTFLFSFFYVPFVFCFYC